MTLSTVVMLYTLGKTLIWSLKGDLLGSDGA